MVDGVKMVFDKQLMINRITSEGRADMIDDAARVIMDDLDGQEVFSNNWRRQVYGDPLYSCTGKSGRTFDVNEADCRVGGCDG